jgi:hypothetical protein
MKGDEVMFFIGLFILVMPMIAFPLANAGHPMLAMGGLSVGFGFIVLAFLYGIIMLYWREFLILGLTVGLCFGFAETGF